MNKLIYLMMILFWSCQDLTNEVTNNSKEIEFESITLIDTFQNRLLLDTAKSITEADFHPMYMGVKKDSIILNYWSGEIEYKSMNWDEYKRVDSNDLIIYVDTTQIIGSVNKYIIPPLPLNIENDIVEYNRKKRLFRGEVKSYPIFVMNITKDTLRVGFGEYIPLIIEAKDSLGSWKPIQEPYIYFCGTGLTNFFLPPDEIIITSCKLFEGNYKTKMRIAFGFDKITKSNEFNGKMNYKQFDELENNK